ncbi:MAG: hypothetical protein FWE69_08095, partial [Clostridiales bacterium]|nr:hypothetical protein [Clostridiales bacterium]
MVFMCLTAACAGGGEHVIIVAGSTSVQPYAEILAEEFEHLIADVMVEIQGGGSTHGVVIEIQGGGSSA